MAWLFVVAAAVACVSPLAGHVAGAATRLGDGLAHDGRAVAAGGLGTALLAWFLPDRGFVVGDALLRRGTLEVEGLRAAVVYPQAMPLELLLHVHLPRFVADAGVADAVTAARAIGALEAGLLVVLAVAFARALGLAGAGAAIAVSVVTFGGWLGLFTGYAKALSELVLGAVAVAALGSSVVRTGRFATALALGVVAGLALLLHRGGLALLPAVLLSLAVAWRRHRTQRVARLALAAVPLFLATAFAGPRIVATMRSIDTAAHFASEDVAHAGGLLAATFQARHLLDLLNVFLFLAPAAVVAAVVALVARRSLRDARLVVPATLALTQAVMAALVHPAQGVFRDWDVFAPAGVSLAILAAAVLGLALGERESVSRARPGTAPATKSIAVAAAFLVAPALALAWLALAADAGRSLARVEAYAVGPPERTAVERAKTWDFLGAARYRLGEPLVAARSFAEAARYAGNPRLYVQQGEAARKGGDLAQAQRAYAEAARRQPDNVAAWRGLGETAWARGDEDTALIAARAMAGLAPGDSSRQAGLRAVERAVAARRAARDSALNRVSSAR